jgi:hypothetical protein
LRPSNSDDCEASGCLDHPPAALTIRALWLADLTADRVRSGTPGRFVFVPDSRPDEYNNRVIVEAAVLPGDLRTVSFAKGEIGGSVDVAAPLVVEGVLLFRLTALHEGHT